MIDLFLRSATPFSNKDKDFTTCENPPSRKRHSTKNLRPFDNYWIFYLYCSSFFWFCQTRVGIPKPASLATWARVCQRTEKRTFVHLQVLVLAFRFALSLRVSESAVLPALVLSISADIYRGKRLPLRPRQINLGPSPFLISSLTLFLSWLPDGLHRDPNRTSARFLQKSSICDSRPEF